MKSIFKKAILIGSITIVMLSSEAKAQKVVSAGGKTFVLTQARITYLKRFADPVINKAIDSCASIKYNSTADVIVAILSSPKAPKVKPLLFTTK